MTDEESLYCSIEQADVQSALELLASHPDPNPKKIVDAFLASTMFAPGQTFHHKYENVSRAILDVFEPLFQRNREAALLYLFAGVNAGSKLSILPEKIFEKILRQPERSKFLVCELARCFSALRSSAGRKMCPFLPMHLYLSPLFIFAYDSLDVPGFGMLPADLARRLFELGAADDKDHSINASFSLQIVIAENNIAVRDRILCSVNPDYAEYLSRAKPKEVHVARIAEKPTEDIRISRRNHSRVHTKIPHLPIPFAVYYPVISLAAIIFTLFFTLPENPRVIRAEQAIQNQIEDSRAKEDKSGGERKAAEAKAAQEAAEQAKLEQQKADARAAEQTRLKAADEAKRLEQERAAAKKKADELRAQKDAQARAAAQKPEEKKLKGKPVGKCIKYGLKLVCPH